MDLPGQMVLQVVAALAMILAMLSLFGVDWSLRLRIPAAMGVGAILVGLICWQCAAPDDPLGVIYAGNFDNTEIIILLVIAFLSGFFAYFAAWPYGKQIAVLAVPTGLAVWAIRDGSMGRLMQTHSKVDQRLAIFDALRWEPFFWLAIVVAGFAGVYAASMLSGKSSVMEDLAKVKKSIVNINNLTAIAVSALIAAVVILQLAQDEKIFDAKTGSLIGQPSIPQITFAVIVGFMAAGFAIKKFLNLNYFWAILAGPVIAAFFSITFLNRATIEAITAKWPAVFFVNSMVCILPIQLIAFGSIGAITGYWMAVRYEYWHEHERE